jgi:hypothetical protein
MKRLCTLLSVACVLLAALPAAPVGANEPLPAVNLGLTSFMDGGPPAGPGWYYTAYLQYFTADEIPGSGIPDVDIDVGVNLNQFIYQSDTPILFGGKWGIDVIVPFVCIDSSSLLLPDNGGGLGDVLVGPFIQWDPIMGENGPVFMHRIELQNIFPTGKHDSDRLLNPGSNYYSFNPYWAGTYFVTPRLTATWRAHYLWNAENDDPFIGFAANDTQAGQAFHTNFAAAYEVMPKKLRVGVNGYYLKGLTDPEVDGVEVSDAKEEVFGIGPGALWHISPDTHLFFNAYFETSAENRPEGERFVLRLVHHF